jgi:hypothetical protein
MIDVTRDAKCGYTVLTRPRLWKQLDRSMAMPVIPEPLCRALQ